MVLYFLLLHHHFPSGMNIVHLILDSMAGYIRRWFSQLPLRAAVAALAPGQRPKLLALGRRSWWWWWW